jgi:outer membrane immunogenic protein
MKNHALALSAAAVAFAAGIMPAAAQDARDTHFDGPYVSGTIGMAAKGSQNETVVFDTNRDGTYGDPVLTAGGAPAIINYCRGPAGGLTLSGGCGGDENRWEFAGRVGYDRRVSNNFVAGLVLEASTNNSRDHVTAFSNTPARYSFVRELDIALSLRARAGFTPGGGALFYVTGGPSFAKIDHTFETTNTANAFNEVNDGKWVFGGQVGGGAEIMLTDNISLGMEYLYNRYRDNKYRVEITQGTAPATNPFLLNGGGTNMRPSNTNYDFHSLRGTLSFQF